MTPQWWHPTHGAGGLPQEGVTPSSALLLWPCCHDANIPWGTFTRCSSISPVRYQARKCVGECMAQVLRFPECKPMGYLNPIPALSHGLSGSELRAEFHQPCSHQCQGQNFSTLCLQSPGQFLPAWAPGFIIAVFQQIHEIHFSSNHSSMATLIMMF